MAASSTSDAATVTGTPGFDESDNTPPLKTIASALTLLSALKPQIRAILLQKRSVKVALDQMDILKPERKAGVVNGNVLYFGPREEGDEGKLLRAVCDLVHRRFKEEGYITETRPLKLHCAILNTSHRKPRRRLPFEYSAILAAPATRALLDESGLVQEAPSGHAQQMLASAPGVLIDRPGAGSRSQGGVTKDEAVEASVSQRLSETSSVAGEGSSDQVLEVGTSKGSKMERPEAKLVRLHEELSTETSVSTQQTGSVTDSDTTTTFQRATAEESRSGTDARKSTLVVGLETRQRPGHAMVPLPPPLRVDMGVWDVEEIQLWEMGSHGPNNEYVNCGGITLG